jgi:iron complex outermembrane receptor protein
MNFLVLASCLLLAAPAFAQQTVQTVTVTAPEPLPISARDLLDRAHVTLELSDPAQLPLFSSPVDWLRFDPSLNLEERGPNGVQADLSLRGSSFEQTLVLVDGLRVNDPETGHLNFDLPIPLEAIQRVDILHGSGSTFFGSDAIGGAVDLVTAAPAHASASLRLGGGSLGATEQHLQASVVTRRFAERLTASRDTSDGFFYAGQDDRGFHSSVAALDSFLTLTPKLAPTEILLGASDRPYGANLFYGPYDSAERSKGWFTSIRQPLPFQLSADFAYRRHTDEFILLVQAPAVYENNHIDSLWQADLRRVSTLHKNFELSYGLEADGDSIRSNSLGRHARNEGAGYANLSLQSLRRLTLSVGARQEIFAGPTPVFSPSASAGFDFGHGLRAHAAYGHGFRLPTYVDLYYSDPTTIGNAALKPETSQSYEGGLDWKPAGSKLALSSTGFTLRQSNAIDYSKYSLSAPYQATNVGRIAYSGVESILNYRPRSGQELWIGYTFLHAAPPPAGLISEYAYNYAANKANAAYRAGWGQVAGITSLEIVQRTGYTAYPLWSLALTRTNGLIRPYLRVQDIANVSYQELPGVPLPGRTIVGGITLSWPSR